jgi:hypothetical protein
LDAEAANNGVVMPGARETLLHQENVREPHSRTLPLDADSVATGNVPLPDKSALTAARVGAF